MLRDLLSTLTAEGHMSVNTSVALYACALFIESADEQTQAEFMRRYGTMSMETVKELLKDE